MGLPVYAPITLLQIQGEYGTSGLAASSTAAGLDPLPTSMLDFLGKSAVSIPSTLPGFGGGWQIYSIDSASIAEFGLLRNGTYYLTLYYNNGYANPAGTNYTGGNGGPVSALTGDWISPKTATSGDSYWIRFSGKRNLNGSGAKLYGYNSIYYPGDIIADSSELNGLPITTMISFNSGWLQLNSLKVIAIGSPTSGAAKLEDLKLEIATDSNGSNIISTTIIGTFVVQTYETPYNSGNQS